MKKVIEKMGAAAGEEQRRALAQEGAGALPPSTSTSSGKEKKKGLFGGALKKVTGGSSASATPAPAAPTGGEGGEGDDGGLQVDYYLVIVSLFAPLLPSDLRSVWAVRRRRPVLIPLSAGRWESAVPQVHRLVSAVPLL